jgi:hypothetical protein
MGRQATATLFRVIEQNENCESCTVEVPVELAVRVSTGPPSIMPKKGMNWI